MNPKKEAIEIIKIAMAEVEWNYPMDYVVAFETAIEALEKQMPTSMDLEGDGYADGVIIYDTWICPRCGKHYELEYDNYDYCPNCGQSLDWEDYDDK